MIRKNSPILTIPGINYRMGAMILAEIGDFNRFDSPDKIFGAYLAKKRAEGKHYNVALSHATKKLVRTIYAMEKSGQAYIKSA